MDASAITAPPRRLRLRLDSLGRIRREVVKLYADARDGVRQPADAHQLAETLAIVARLVEAGELERRLQS